MSTLAYPALCMTTNIEYPRHDITGIVLAGGRASRMGGIDKGLIPLHGRPMIEHVIAVLEPQVGRIMINANRNREQYAALGYHVIADALDGYLGPLAGIASGMQAASTSYVLAVPCDSPLISVDLGQRLYRALVEQQAEISVAHDGERMHPVFALLRRDLLPSLVDYLESGGRKIDRWFTRHRLAIAYFRDVPQAFMNVNSPEERAELEDNLRQSQPC